MKSRGVLMHFETLVVGWWGNNGVRVPYLHSHLLIELHSGGV